MRPGTCLVVMYHYVRDSDATPFPAIRALAPAMFEQQLDWLESEYRVITQSQFEDAVAGRTVLPDNAALLTFDDGFIDHYEAVCPILLKRGLSGVFFISHNASGPAPQVLSVHKTHFLLAKLGPDAFGRAVVEECDIAYAASSSAARSRVFGADHWEHANERAIKDLLNYELPFADASRLLDALFAHHIGDDGGFARRLYLDAARVTEMARAGMSFGYHTRSHRMLSRLSVAEQVTELKGGVRWIQELTGQRTVPFCYPWGSPKTYTADTLRILAETGYALAFNTVRRHVSLDSDSRFELPRFDTRDLPPYTSGESEALAVGPPVDEA